MSVLTKSQKTSFVVSVQHRADKDLEVLRSEIISQVLWPVFEKFPFDDDTEILINPSGRFVEGGPAADTGLTGRKIMVDSYGGLAAHGGGAFSGKDPTKVDRSGAYMARAIAKNIVRCGYAKRCQVAISYAIGKADPVAVEIETFGTGTVSDEVLRKAVLEVFNLRPAAIIETLSLRDAIYADTATYGHFRGTLSRWEWLDCYKELQEAVKKYVFHADTEGLNFRRAFSDAGFYLSGCCIWKKQSLVLGRSPYQWQHEPVLYGWKKNGKHQWYTGRKETTIWEFDKPKKNGDHPTMKPIPLLAYPIMNSSMSNTLVLDPFGGSGSTLIACEQSDRSCYTIELDEKFCDVIVKRYIEQVGSADKVSVQRDGLLYSYAEVTAGEDCNP